MGEKSMFLKGFHFKGPMQCFSIQVIINKCFSYTPKKFGADPTRRFREKRKTA